MPALTTLLLGLVTSVLAVVGVGPHGTWPIGPGHHVVGPFDPPAAPWAAGHRGVDLLGSPGEAVRAALPGTVTFAGTIAGRGVVVVDHGDRRTTYEPVDAAVAVGDSVAEGAVIGRLQLGLSHCFPRACLHWGLIRGDTYLDPLTLVGGGPVRLLPLDGAPGGSTLLKAFVPALNRVVPAPLAPLAAVLERVG